MTTGILSALKSAPVFCLPTGFCGLRGCNCLQGEAGESTSKAEQAMVAGEVALDRCLLKLFNAAVRGDKLQQALEAACQLSQVRSLEGAIKLANHNRQTALADRIALFLETRLEQEAAEAEQVSSAAFANAAYVIMSYFPDKGRLYGERRH